MAVVLRDELPVNRSRRFVSVKYTRPGLLGAKKSQKEENSPELIPPRLASKASLYWVVQREKSGQKKSPFAG